MTPTAGVVTSFDAEVGLGAVTAGDGQSYPFHCVAIADGSRWIAVGTPVEFALVAKLGRHEAWSIRPS